MSEHREPPAAAQPATELMERVERMIADTAHQMTLGTTLEREFFRGWNAAYHNIRNMLNEPSLQPPAAQPATERLIDEIVRQVAELPDRTSPDDWPEAMLVTQAELSQILSVALQPPAAVVQPEKPLTGVFDNRSTMQRERWRNGELVESMTARYILSEDFLHPWGDFPPLPATPPAAVVSPTCSKCGEDVSQFHTCFPKLIDPDNLMDEALTHPGVKAVEDLQRLTSAVVSPREEPKQHTPPAVHHLCGPNVIGVTGPPHASWCWHDRTWVDGAAQQDDYTCSVCGTKISTNISEWRAASVPLSPEGQEKKK